jgi:hypothetical protein
MAIGSSPYCQHQAALPSLSLTSAGKEGRSRVLKLLPAQLPWWLAGPGVQLCVIALPMAVLLPVVTVAGLELGYGARPAARDAPGRDAPDHAALGGATQEARHAAS